MTETQNPTETQRLATELLRETGYNASIIKGSGDMGEGYSRAMGLWQSACNLVREAFPQQEAARMIDKSWNPNKVEQLNKRTGPFINTANGT